MAKARISLSQAIEGYFLAAHARRLSPHTMADYDNTFRQFEEFLKRDPPLAEITADDVRAFLNSRNGLSDKTVRGYLDVLTGTFMVRHLQPWHANVGKRQVRSPKVYLRDSGLLHSLLEIRDRRLLLGHPQSGASFEGFVIEQVLQAVSPLSAYFWGTHGGGELDLFFVLDGRRHGVEVKLSEAPSATGSMWTSIRDLSLDHLWVVYPGRRSYQVREDVTVWPVEDVGALPDAMRKVRSRRRRVRPTAPAGRTPRSG